MRKNMLLKGKSDFYKFVFTIMDYGDMREEIEVGLMSLNGNEFVRSITPQEVKYFQSTLTASQICSKISPLGR